MPTPATTTAARSPLPNPPADCIELIKSFEGIPDGDPRTVNIDAYLCPAGVWTIGWGHALVDGGQQLCGPANLPRARALYPGGITIDQAELLLKADLLPRCVSVCSAVRRPLNDGQLGALVAFVYNVGAANFGASSLLRLLNQGDVAGAADQFLRWDKARVNGVLQPLAGLTRRRKTERAMFLGEDWRAAAASRSRSRAGESLAPLPVPEPPDDQLIPAVAAELLSPELEAVAAEAGAPTRRGASAAVKPPGQTTRSKALPPAQPAKPPGRPAKR